MSSKPKIGELQMSKSVNSLDIDNQHQTTSNNQKITTLGITPIQINATLNKAQLLYNSGSYTDALTCCDKIYEADSHRTDNLLLLGAIHFQMRNFSESIFYNQQCIRVDPSFAESYSNLGNSLKELGDLTSAIDFYNKAIKLKPRFSDAYNNLAGVYMQVNYF